MTQYPLLENINQELAKNPELSDHNKKILEKFFQKCSGSGTGMSTQEDYASRFNALAEYINFDLDNPEREDIEGLVSKLNADLITKKNQRDNPNIDDPEPYTDDSKIKFWKTLYRFYNLLIKRKGRGYNEEVDGPALFEDLKLRAEPNNKVEPETKAKPEEIRELAESTNNLRNKALILFGWATGTRVGELSKTAKDPDPIRWEDIKFRGDSHISVVANEDGKDNRGKGKTGRTIPVRISMPIMRKFYERENPDQKDPVFRNLDQSLYCPRCSTQVTRCSRTSYEKREYECENCSWRGRNFDADKKRKPLTDDSIRKILRRCYERSDIDRELDVNPHALFRKSRALNRAAVGWSENRLRAFFGWSENSDSPEHYITIREDDLVTAIEKEFGEGKIESTDDGFSNDNAMKPIECPICGRINSAVEKFCRNCDRELDEELRQHNKTESELEAEDMQETLLDMAEQAGLEKSEFREIVKNNK
jgi:integrase